MKINNKYLSAFLYAIGYAALATLLSILLENSPILLKVENAFYDPLQRFLAIDYLNDWRTDRFQSELDQIYCIRLDDTFIDFENDRVKRDQLADLLDTLSKEDDIKAIFLDFIFEPLDTTPQGLLSSQDSILYESMLRVGNRLTLLRDSCQKTIFDKNAWTTSNYQNQGLSIHPKAGNILMESIRWEDVVRYINLNTTKESCFPSFLEIFTHQIKDEEILRCFQETPSNFELNYLVRDNRPRGLQSALSGDDASMIIKHGIHPEYFKNEQEKIVFIGAFKGLTNKYNLAFDSFETPVSNQLSGIYINLNAYLNITTQSYIRRASYPLIFSINFLIALLGVIYFHIVQKKVKEHFIKPHSWLFYEIAICSLIFLISMYSLFYWHYMKFPFAFSLLFFIRNQSLYKRIVHLTKT